MELLEMDVSTLCNSSPMGFVISLFPIPLFQFLVILSYFIFLYDSKWPKLPPLIPLTVSLMFLGVSNMNDMSLQVLFFLLFLFFFFLFSYLSFFEGCGDGSIKLFDVEAQTGRPLRVFHEHQQEVSPLFSPPPSSLLTPSLPSSLLLKKKKKKKKKRFIPFNGTKKLETHS